MKMKPPSLYGGFSIRRALAVISAEKVISPLSPTIRQYLRLTLLSKLVYDKIDIPIKDLLERHSITLTIMISLKASLLQHR